MQEGTFDLLHAAHVGQLEDDTESESDKTESQPDNIITADTDSELDDLPENILDSSTKAINNSISWQNYTLKRLVNESDSSQTALKTKYRLRKLLQKTGDHNLIMDKHTGVIRPQSVKDEELGGFDLRIDSKELGQLFLNRFYI